MIMYMINISIIFFILDMRKNVIQINLTDT